MKLVFCTNNRHKIEEVTAIMGTGFSFLTLQEVSYFDEIPEPFHTLEENSLIKSKQVADKLGLDCFSEDTGLFVQAINDEPGVLSARYAGDNADSSKNIEKLLKKMHGIDQREAYFKTVITLLFQGETHQFEGVCKGTISTEIRGKEGFGYDPIFIPNGFDKSFAELDPAVKNSISHRKKAFEKFKEFFATQQIV